MTEPLDPSAGHLDLETLADLDEGLLEPERVGAAQAHLAGCAQCRDDLAALTRVRELLAADADDPSLTMPGDVADRLHAALAAQPPLAPTDQDAAADSAGPVAATAEPYAPVVVTTLPERPVDHRRRNQWLGGVLAAAAVIVLFALGISVLPHSSESTSSSAAATSAAPVVAPTSSGRDYTKTGLGTQALALIGRAPASSAAAAGSSAAAASSAPASSAPASSAPASSAPASSAASSAAASAAGSSAPASAGPTLASAAPGGQKSPANGGSDGTSAATSAAGTSAATSSSAAPAPDPLAALRRPGAAQACLSSYDSQAGAPLAIDFATFDGKPAVIGVFNDPSHAGQFEVVAVGPPGCSLYQFARPTLP